MAVRSVRVVLVVLIRAPREVRSVRVLPEPTMLVALSIRNFESIRDAHVRFGPCTCFISHNGEGRPHSALRAVRALAVEMLRLVDADLDAMLANEAISEVICDGQAVRE